MDDTKTIKYRDQRETANEKKAVTLNKKREIINCSYIKRHKALTTAILEGIIKIR